MTYPRAHLVDAENGGLYHCISRCVRQAWLCGDDRETKRSFEHRRGWIESRLLELTRVFAVDMYGYAVMSNHYHVVADVAPRRARTWSAEEVAARWSVLCPGRTPEETQRKTEAIVSDPARVDALRQRLGSLSWFMRFINESIARRANREDEVTGRFWEGRFKSIALLDECAVVACMAYVDLNPVRAQIAACVAPPPYTAIARRVGHVGDIDLGLAPLENLGLTLDSYRALLEWTAEADEDTTQVHSEDASRALSNLGQRPEAWLKYTRSHGKKYRAYGALGLLRQYAEALSQRWLQGASLGMAAHS
ncbi:MAG: transposase [bacterium]|nr:transposase [bacterium]